MICDPKPHVNGEKKIKNKGLFLSKTYYRTVWMRFLAEATASEGRSCHTVPGAMGREVFSHQ